MRTLYFRPVVCSSSSSSSFFFSSPIIPAVADWMSAILPQMALVRINLECMSEMCCTWLAGNAGPKKVAKNSSPGHHRTTLLGYIFLRHISTIGKNSNISSTCSRNMVNLGPLAAEVGLPLWGTLYFNGFLVLAALLHGTLLQWASAKLRR